MRTLLKYFKSDESGAVTVDWVVLTAAIVGLGLMIILVFVEALTGATSLLYLQLGTAMDTAVALN
ncbi:MAG: pilus assembly protein [Cereibacter sphaeroides]|uniref:Pilus assembly protein n=1 Tax=Cereibacter sphaeroides TaxID=1063 RepID=A0A2W5SMG3_CERSP|nr:MAG: pilus assembly protein [Cereibacter sphaeroides]